MSIKFWIGSHATKPTLKREAHWSPVVVEPRTWVCSCGYAFFRIRDDRNNPVYLQCAGCGEKFFIELNQVKII